MKWTSEKPTKPGWYWYRGETDLNELIIWVSSDLRVVYPASLNFKSFAVDEVPGQWAGPIEPPT